MANPNKQKPPDSPARAKTTTQKIGFATVGLVALSTLSAGLALGVAAACGAVLISKKRKKAKEKKKNRSGKKQSLSAIITVTSKLKHVGEQILIYLHAPLKGKITYG